MTMTEKIYVEKEIHALFNLLSPAGFGNFAKPRGFQGAELAAINLTPLMSADTIIQLLVIYLNHVLFKCLINVPDSHKQWLGLLKGVNIHHLILLYFCNNCFV